MRRHGLVQRALARWWWRRRVATGLPDGEHLQRLLLMLFTVLLPLDVDAARGLAREREEDCPAFELVAAELGGDVRVALGRAAVAVDLSELDHCVIERLVQALDTDATALVVDVAVECLDVPLLEDLRLLEYFLRVERRILKAEREIAALTPPPL